MLIPAALGRAWRAVIACADPHSSLMAMAGIAASLFNTSTANVQMKPWELQLHREQQVVFPWLHQQQPKV